MSLLPKVQRAHVPLDSHHRREDLPTAGPQTPVGHLHGVLVDNSQLSKDVRDQNNYV